MDLDEAQQQGTGAGGGVDNNSHDVHLFSGSSHTASLLRRQYPYYHELIGRHYETWVSLRDRKYACNEYLHSIVDHEVDQAYFHDSQTGIRRVLPKEELLDYMRQRFRDEKRKRSAAVFAVAVVQKKQQQKKNSGGGWTTPVAVARNNNNKNLNQKTNTTTWWRLLLLLLLIVLFVDGTFRRIMWGWGGGCWDALVGNQN
jgi:hypothetical protein